MVVVIVAAEVIVVVLVSLSESCISLFSSVNRSIFAVVAVVVISS
jgi:hypothetical protein